MNKLKTRLQILMHAFKDELEREPFLKYPLYFWVFSLCTFYNKLIIFSTFAMIYAGTFWLLGHISERMEKRSAKRLRAIIKSAKDTNIIRPGMLSNTETEILSRAIERRKSESY